jgi:hypothetical protein
MTASLQAFDAQLIAVEYERGAWRDGRGRGATIPEVATDARRRPQLQRVRLHIADDGALWVLSGCAGCGEVDTHLATIALVGPISCKKCGRLMHMQGPTIEAIETARASGTTTPPDVTP